MESLFLTFHFSCERFPAQLRGVECDTLQDSSTRTLAEWAEVKSHSPAFQATGPCFQIIFFLYLCVLESSFFSVVRLASESCGLSVLQPLLSTSSLLCWNSGLAVQQSGSMQGISPAKWLLQTNVPLVALALISWTLKDSLVRLQHQLRNHC